MLQQTKIQIVSVMTYGFLSFHLHLHQSCIYRTLKFTASTNCQYNAITVQRTSTVLWKLLQNLPLFWSLPSLLINLLQIKDLGFPVLKEARGVC